MNNRLSTLGLSHARPSLTPSARTVGAALSMAVSLLASVASAQSAPAQTAPVAPLNTQAQLAPRAVIQMSPAMAQGVVVRFVLGPMGRVRAMVLDSGAVIMLGHDGEAVATRAGVGARVRASGFVSSASASTIVAATIMDASGNVISQPNPQAIARMQQRQMQPMQPGQSGPVTQPMQPMQPGQGPGMMHAGRRHRHGQGMGRMHQMQQRIQALPIRVASGTVQTLIAGPRGHLRGVLLSDGTSVTFDHQLSRAAQAQGLAVGQNLRVQGHGEQYARGVAVMAQQVTFANGVTVASVAHNPTMGAQPSGVSAPVAAPVRS